MLTVLKDQGSKCVLDVPHTLPVSAKYIWAWWNNPEPKRSLQLNNKTTEVVNLEMLSSFSVLVLEFFITKKNAIFRQTWEHWKKTARFWTVVRSVRVLFSFVSQHIHGACHLVQWILNECWLDKGSWYGELIIYIFFVPFGRDGCFLYSIFVLNTI